MAVLFFFWGEEKAIFCYFEVTLALFLRYVVAILGYFEATFGYVVASFVLFCYCEATLKLFYANLKLLESTFRLVCACVRLC